MYVGKGSGGGGVWVCARVFGPGCVCVYVLKMRNGKECSNREHSDNPQ